MWGISPSFVYTGLLARVSPHLHRLNVTHYSKSSPLHAVCFLFICITDPTQICPSPILLELLELFQDVNCNNERLKGEALKPWITELLLHGKPFFFFFLDVLKRRSFQKNCAGIGSFLHYRERWYFFFPKIWSYTLNGNWKMIFLKKYTKIWYFLQTFWKYGLSKKCRTGTWSLLYYMERWYFFPENMIFFPWAESERRPFSGNTWKHDASPSEKNRKPDI